MSVPGPIGQVLAVYSVRTALLPWIYCPMLNLFARLNHTPLFWLALLTLCACTEAVALFYQYQLDYGPCVLCVQIRAWIAGLMLVMATLLLVRHTPRRVVTLANLLLLLLASGFVYSAYITLGIERGFVDGSCSLQQPFPSWLPLHTWLPVLFEPWETCGYTPELLFGISMAEGLIVFALALWLLAATLLIAQLNRAPHQKPR